MQRDATQVALEAARIEIRRLHGKLQRTTARAILAEDRLRDLEAERDSYARRWAQAEAARMALAGEGLFADAPEPQPAPAPDASGSRGE